MKSVALFATALATLALSGCANFFSVHRTLDTQSGQGVLIDIKQRAIVAGERDSKRVVCAEPSPDAMAAYAAELAGKSEKAGVELAAAMQEGAAFVGLRTSAIQLLRDQLFNTCLQYMNGALSAAQYELVARRYQRQVVVLLAVEQLTGALKAPPVTLSTQGLAAVSRESQKLVDELAAIDKDLATLEADKKGKSSDEVKAIETQITEKSENRKKTEQALENVRETLASGKVTVNVSGTGVAASRSDAHVQAVAGTVERLVLEITRVDDSPYFCLMGIDGKGTETDALKDHCTALRALHGEAMKVQEIMATAMARKITEAKVDDAIRLMNEWAKLGSAWSGLPDNGLTTKNLPLPFGSPAQGSQSKNKGP